MGCPYKIYLPPMKLRQGHIFSRACLSTRVPCDPCPQCIGLHHRGTPSLYRNPTSPALAPLSLQGSPPASASLATDIRWPKGRNVPTCSPRGGALKCSIVVVISCDRYSWPADGTQSECFLALNTSRQTCEKVYIAQHTLARSLRMGAFTSCHLMYKLFSSRFRNERNKKMYY